MLKTWPTKSGPLPFPVEILTVEGNPKPESWACMFFVHGAEEVGWGVPDWAEGGYSNRVDSNDKGTERENSGRRRGRWIFEKGDGGFEVRLAKWRKHERWWRRRRSAAEAMETEILQGFQSSFTKIFFERIKNPIFCSLLWDLSLVTRSIILNYLLIAPSNFINLTIFTSKLGI